MQAKTDQTVGYNYHFNDDFYLRVFPDMQGPAWYRGTRIVHVHGGQRLVYLADRVTGEGWNPSETHLPRTADHRDWDPGDILTTLRSRTAGIETEWSIATPGDAAVEIWHISVRNADDEERSLTFGLALPLSTGGHMGAQTRYDRTSGTFVSEATPIHGAYREYNQIAADPHATLARVWPEPDAVCCSLREFHGGRPVGALPYFFDDGGRGSEINSAEPPLFACRWKFNIAPGATTRFYLTVTRGHAEEEARELSLDDEHAWQAALASAQQYLERHSGTMRIETPDSRLDDMVNRGLRKEILWETRLWRNGISTPWRNELQDALGYALWNPDEAIPYLEAVTRVQEPSGYLKVWNTRGGEKPNHPLVNLRHTDGGIWLAISWLTMMRVTGRWDLWNHRIEYSDGSSGSLRDHLLRAIEFSFDDRGSHGLLLMHDGDWTDPMNGPGHKGKGESGWATQALLYACSLLRDAASDQNETELLTSMRSYIEELEKAVDTHLWTRERYAYGFDDSGHRFGDDSDGRTYLNTQSWGLIGQTAGGQSSHSHIIGCTNAITRLQTPYGPRLLDPPFERWDPVVGRVSLKVPGTTENGSVYCHAAVFAAYGLAMVGDPDAALDIILRTIPGHPEHRTDIPQQIPLYQPNSYFYRPGHPQNGLSSGTLGTGTCTWIVLTLFELFLGIHFTPQGLRIAPSLPSAWNSASISFERDTTRFFIQVQRDSADHEDIFVNGESCGAQPIAWKGQKELKILVRAV